MSRRRTQRRAQAMATKQNEAEAVARRLGKAIVSAVALLLACSEPSLPVEKASIEELRSRAEAGEVDAQTELGDRYSLGEGVVDDDAEAVRWYRQAADRGYAPAQVDIGLMYDIGAGVEQDWAEALGWYKRAAKQRYPMGLAFLGQMHRDGKGVPKDGIEAYKWFSLATTYRVDVIRPAGSDIYRRDRELVSGRLTPNQLAEAQRRAREFIEAHPPE